MRNFYATLPTEEECKEIFKKDRDSRPNICPKCGCEHHDWISKRGGMYQCKKCHYRQGLKANTVMHHSKLPFQMWYIAMYFIAVAHGTFTAKQLQEELGINRYMTVWNLAQKIRRALGHRDAKYMLKGEVEADEAHFVTGRPKDCKQLQRGAGSERMTKVFVAAESTPVKDPKPNQKSKACGFIKMAVIPDMKAPTLDATAQACIDSSASIVSDGTGSHVHFPSLFAKYNGQVVKAEDIIKILPWVHIAISNAKTYLRAFFGVNEHHLEAYLAAYCYKFNRRNLTDRMAHAVTAMMDCKNEFIFRPYKPKKKAEPEYKAAA